MLQNKMIGELIKKGRQAKGMTQDQLAEIVYVSKQAVSQWENGRTRPSMEILKTLSQHLEISIDSFYGEKRRGNMKELHKIQSFHDLEDAATNLVAAVEFDNAYKATMTKLVTLTLFTVLGYECYYFTLFRNKDPEFLLYWEDIANDISNLIDDNDDWPFFENKEYRKSITAPSFASKVQYMHRRIGGELFEDSDEDGYRNGFPQQIGRYAEACSADLLKLLPLPGSDLDVVLKVSLLNLSEVIEELLS